MSLIWLRCWARHSANRDKKNSDCKSKYMWWRDRAGSKRGITRMASHGERHLTWDLRDGLRSQMQDCEHNSLRHKSPGRSWGKGRETGGWRASSPILSEPTAMGSHQKGEKRESCNLGSFLLFCLFVCFCKGNAGSFVENESDVGRSARRKSITTIQVRTWWFGLSGSSWQLKKWRILDIFYKWTQAWVMGWKCGRMVEGQGGLWNNLGFSFCSCIVLVFHREMRKTEGGEAHYGENARSQFWTY